MKELAFFTRLQGWVGGGCPKDLGWVRWGCWKWVEWGRVQGFLRSGVGWELGSICLKGVGW